MPTDSEKVLSERCVDCDKPLAVENNHEGGCECPECVGMCWREWSNDICQHPIDWRGRALKAESALASEGQATHPASLLSLQRPGQPKPTSEQGRE